MGPVPLDGPAQTLLQANRWLPPGQLAQLAVIEPLAVDLTVRGALTPDLRLDRTPDQAADEADHLAHAVSRTPARIEGLAVPLAATQRIPDGQIGPHRVLDIEEVALRRPVRAEDRRSAGQSGADG